MNVLVEFVHRVLSNLDVCPFELQRFAVHPVRGKVVTQVFVQPVTDCLSRLVKVKPSPDQSIFQHLLQLWCPLHVLKSFDRHSSIYSVVFGALVIRPQTLLVTLVSGIVNVFIINISDLPVFQNLLEKFVTLCHVLFHILNELFLGDAA
jgi:hypothetical protein